jgi:hypothetical protein
VFHNYGDVFSYDRRWALRGSGDLLLELGHNFGKALASKGPAKGSGDLFVMLLKSQEALLEFRQRRESFWVRTLR